MHQYIYLPLFCSPVCYQIVVERMSDDIEFTQPDWANLPEECPHCGTNFETTLSQGEAPTFHYKYEDGESTHGEYTQIVCVRCECIIQRHYEDGDVTTQDDPLISPSRWVYRAQVLENETGLKHREAQVQALKELEKSHAEIAERLGISESTVGEYSRRVSMRINEAARTLETLGDNVDPLRHIEGQFDGWVFTPAKRWRCANCDDELAPSDRAVIVAEFVGQQWQPIEIYCTECPSDDYVTAIHGDVIDLEEFLDENRDYGVTCAVVEGELDTQGDDYVDVPHTLDFRDSLTLRDPDIREVLN